MSYLEKFTQLNSYQHRVFARHTDKIFSLPINLVTICEFFGKALSPDEAKSLISSQTQDLKVEEARNLEEKAISLIGAPLYEAFIKNYSQKQWQVEPKLLPPEIIARLPVRYTMDNRYFSDTFEGIPMDGYATWIERMADHPNISIILNTDYFEIKDSLPDKYTVYTGPLDRYFNYQLGELTWRTLEFEMEILNTGDFQGTSVVNYPDLEYPFTRIHEFRHFHPERRDYPKDKTVIMREFSRQANLEDEPYYPVNSVADRDKLLGYRELSITIPNVLFGGRLGTYQYLDMHMAIAAALSDFDKTVTRWFS